MTQKAGCGFGIRAAAAIFTSAFLAACTTLVASPTERATLLAAENGFVAVATTSGLQVFLRRGSENKHLTIYIEGDGAKWPHGQPPVDPTPLNPLALKLAIKDANSSNGHVAYVARPCQFLESTELARCPPSQWTDARFGAIAMASTASAIDALVRQTQASKVTLVGYSGGGTLAALVAAKRQDVACLVSVAAPLDTEAWVSAHKVSPLLNSLNPARQTPLNTTMQQVHFQGLADNVVPAETTRIYQRTNPQARFEVVTGYDHECCWEETWAARIKNACR